VIFGLARFNEPNQLETLGKLCGTLSYTAPELYFGQTYNEKSDIFSVGIIFWELAFRATNGRYESPYVVEYPQFTKDYQIFFNVAKNNKRPTMPSETPVAFVDIFNKCVEANGVDRPTAVEILDALEKMETNVI